MDLKIAGKVALVTGASRGLGRGIALALAEEGCRIAVCGRTEEQLEEVVVDLESRSVEAIGIRADLAHPAAAESVVSQVINRFGGVDILVNNVGGEGKIPSGPLELVPESHWDETLNLNLWTTVRFTRQVIPGMKRQRWGRVLAIASRHGKEGGGRPWYTLSKSAVISMMKTFARDQELARQGITFNSIAPGAILTEKGAWRNFLDAEPERFREKVERDIPAGRPGDPKEVAAVAAFLCSDLARYVSGACVPVDGAASHSF